MTLQSKGLKTWIPNCHVRVSKAILVGISLGYSPVFTIKSSSLPPGDRQLMQRSLKTVSLCACVLKGCACTTETKMCSRLFKHTFVASLLADKFSLCSELIHLPVLWTKQRCGYGIRELIKRRASKADRKNCVPCSLLDKAPSLNDRPHVSHQ